MATTTFSEQVRVALDAHDFGTATAQKRGRNPRFPYVPVIRHHTGGKGGDGYQEQIRARAFASRDEAIAHAQAVLNQRRSNLGGKVLNPAYRALRESLGLPREIPS